MAYIKTMGDDDIMEELDTTVTNPVTAVEEDVAHKTIEIGAEAVVVEPTLILKITVGHTECVPIRIKTEGPQQMATKSTCYGVTRCMAVR